MMNIGIIILFSNNEEDIEENQFEDYINQNIAKLCFVNIASKDKTLLKLKSIRSKAFNTISILDIKRDKGIKSAIKSGVRYLINKEEFKLIVYLNFYKYKNNIELKQVFDVFKTFNFPFIKLVNDRITLQENVLSLDELLKRGV